MWLWHHRFCLDRDVHHMTFPGLSTLLSVKALKVKWKPLSHLQRHLPDDTQPIKHSDPQVCTFFLSLTKNNFMGLIKLAGVDISKWRLNNDWVIAPSLLLSPGLDWVLSVLRLAASLPAGAANLSRGLSPSYLPLALHAEEVLQGLGPADSDWPVSSLWSAFFFKQTVICKLNLNGWLDYTHTHTHACTRTLTHTHTHAHTHCTSSAVGEHTLHCLRMGVLLFLVCAPVSP